MLETVEKMSKTQCLCHRQRPFSTCCEPYLLGSALAPTAEALMRSRYSAFCQGNLDYLMSTHHPTYRKADERLGLRESVNNTQWTNLLIVSTQKGKAKDKTGTVTFVAAYRRKPLPIMGLSGEFSGGLPGRTSGDASGEPSDPLLQLHERSRFVKENGHWLYTEGDILPLYRPKRTHPCWCGSGKKFKQCHA